MEAATDPFERFVVLAEEEAMGFTNECDRPFYLGLSFRVPIAGPSGYGCEFRMTGSNKKQAGITPACSGSCFVYGYLAAATAVTKLAPLGVPSPVTLSHPGPTFSDVSVPKLSAYQRVEVPW